MAKGHLLRPDDIRILELEGMREIWVNELEEDEIHEDQAVCGLASEMACGSYEVQIVPGGRANLIATENVSVLVDEDLLRQMNCTTGLVIATTMNFSLATKGQKIASIKSAPFAVSRSDFDGSINILRERGPILQARPIANDPIGVIYSDPVNGERARGIFEPIVKQKLERFGVYSHIPIASLESEGHLSRGIQYLLRSRAGVILIASTTAPAGPEDAVGLAMTKVGCSMERFLAPVEPGHLLLLGYKNDVPVISAPGCFRSAKQNVVDLLLPPMMARYRISRWEVACMGHGGLLTQ
jgi:molybdenum cofactor cytidylyltransferase